MTTIPHANAHGASSPGAAPPGARAFTPNATALSVRGAAHPDTGPSPSARGAVASDASPVGAKLPDALLALSPLGHFNREEAPGAGVTDSQLRR